MRTTPATPLDALIVAVARTDESHPAETIRRAVDLRDALADLGWHLSPDVSVPAAAPAGDRRAADRICDLIDRAYAVGELLERCPVHETDDPDCGPGYGCDDLRRPPSQPAPPRTGPHPR